LLERAIHPFWNKARFFFLPTMHLPFYHPVIWFHCECMVMPLDFFLFLQVAYFSHVMATSHTQSLLFYC
jgi:hypothetical protein